MLLAGPYIKKACLQIQSNIYLLVFSVSLISNEFYLGPVKFKNAIQDTNMRGEFPYNNCCISTTWLCTATEPEPGNAPLIKKTHI